MARKRFYIAIMLAIGLGGTFMLLSAEGQEKEVEMKTHLTLYVGGELLRDGGTVIVTSIPVSEEMLKSFTGKNPAEDDPGNEKRAHLSKDDLLFGTHVSGRVNFVEMYYLEGGTFGFNLVVDPREKGGRGLRTRRILIGSTGMPSPQNQNKWVDADTSTIVIEGKNASDAESRLMRMEQWRIMALGIIPIHHQGVTVYAPSSEQLTTGTLGVFNE